MNNLVLKVFIDYIVLNLIVILTYLFIFHRLLLNIQGSNFLKNVWCAAKTNLFSIRIEIKILNKKKGSKFDRNSIGS